MFNDGRFYPNIFTKFCIIFSSTKNHGLSVQVTQNEQVARKENSLQHEYNDLNQFNWKNWNNMKTLQTKRDQLTKYYKKMEQSNYEQEINI
jgi:hypothetical protein